MSNPLTKKFSWSFSQLDAFDTCPYQLREVRLTKRFSDRNKWNVMGTDDHSVIENRVAKGTPLTPKLAGYEEPIARLMEIPGVKKPELEVCLTEDWQPTGWFAKDAWARAKIDLNILNRDKHRVIQIDWKTGKRRKPNRFFQLKVNNLLYDATCKAHGFVLERFDNALVWVADRFDVERFKTRQEDMDDIRCEVMEKVETYQRAYDADRFPPKQNGLCRRHCPVIDCKFNGRR